jgi:hypothetical protein
MTLFYAQCQCGEVQPCALKETTDGAICANCEARQRGRPQRRCDECGELAPFELHHVHGRKNSNITKPLCLNCHRKIHALAKRRNRREQ